MLQKIEGISKPALGQANFNFLFTHKVSKSIGPWPCSTRGFQVLCRGFASWTDQAETRATAADGRQQP